MNEYISAQNRDREDESNLEDGLVATWDQIERNSLQIILSASEDAKGSTRKTPKKLHCTDEKLFRNETI